MSLPGDFFAVAMSSLSEPMLVPGLTTTISGEAETLVMGTRSEGLYPSLGLSAGLTEMLAGLAMSTV